MQTLLSKFLEYEEKVIPNQFWDEISVFSRYIISVSGGVDSTFIAWAFYERGYDAELFWNNTFRSLRQARQTLIELFQLTNWPFYIAYPENSQREVTAKTRQVVQRIVKTNQRIIKKNIPCCYYLKEKPYRLWIKNNTDMDTLMISGIAGYESMQRQIRLGELRNKNTFLRFKKTENRWFGYPLRDLTNAKHRILLKGILDNIFTGVSESGCFTCPILALVDEKYLARMNADPIRVRQSKAVWLSENCIKM